MGAQPLPFLFRQRFAIFASYKIPLEYFTPDQLHPLLFPTWMHAPSSLFLCEWPLVYVLRFFPFAEVPLALYPWVSICPWTWVGLLWSSPLSLLNIRPNHRASHRPTLHLSVKPSGSASPRGRRFIWHVGAIHVDSNLGCWSSVNISTF